MEEELLRLKGEALACLASAQDSDALESCRVNYLGRKGLFSTVMRNLGKAAEEDRPIVM